MKFQNINYYTMFHILLIFLQNSKFAIRNDVANFSKTTFFSVHSAEFHFNIIYKSCFCFTR